MRGRTVAIGLTLAIVAGFEGYRQVDYYDPVGIPTACFGHTATAVAGTVRTQADCENLLLSDLRLYQAGVLNCTEVPLNDNQLAAYTSFSYNVGVRAYCGSTLARKLNQGDYTGACEELPRWVFARGVKLPGLVRRREQEMQICLSEPVLPQY